MKEATMQEILKRAEECNKKKIKWHFHILTPECAFSKGKRYSIVFESETEHLIVYFKEKPPRQEKLEILFHGRD